MLYWNTLGFLTGVSLSLQDKWMFTDLHKYRSGMLDRSVDQPYSVVSLNVCQMFTFLLWDACIMGATNTVWLAGPLEQEAVTQREEVGGFKSF